MERTNKVYIYIYNEGWKWVNLFFFEKNVKWTFSVFCFNHKTTQHTTPLNTRTILRSKQKNYAIFSFFLKVNSFFLFEALGFYFWLNCIMRNPPFTPLRRMIHPSIRPFLKGESSFERLIHSSKKGEWKGEWRGESSFSKGWIGGFAWCT